MNDHAYCVRWWSLQNNMSIIPSIFRVLRAIRIISIFNWKISDYSSLLTTTARIFVSSPSSKTLDCISNHQGIGVSKHENSKNHFMITLKKVIRLYIQQYHLRQWIFPHVQQFDTVVHTRPPQVPSSSSLFTHSHKICAGQSRVLPRFLTSISNIAFPIFIVGAKRMPTSTPLYLSYR